MFRHARGGVVETTARRLATACRIDKATVVRAQRRLEAAGIILTNWKSMENGRPSKYGMHARPADCLAKLLSRRSPK
jgi:predicted transcriptional regulator